jgi:AcrR family transcriptional regulator
MPRPAKAPTKTPTPGELRRHRRADARRFEILRAAARVFRERGFAAAGMREIALAADLSPGNLYHYFQGKDDILFFCQDQSLDRLLAALDRAVRARGPVPPRLRELAVAHVLCLVDDVHGFSVHHEVDELPPALRGAIVAKRDLYERGVRRLVLAGARRRELRRLDAKIATRAFLGALNWTAQWFRPEGPVSPERVAAIVADFAVGGLLAAAPEGVARGPIGEHHGNGQRRADAGRVRVVQDAARGLA